MSDARVLNGLRSLNSRGVAVTACISAGGRLGHVGQLALKLSAWDLHATWPAIHTVVIAEEQALDMDGVEPLVGSPHTPDGRANISRDPTTDLHIIRAATLRDAIELIALDRLWANRRKGMVARTGEVVSTIIGEFSDPGGRPRLRQDGVHCGLVASCPGMGLAGAGGSPFH